MSSKNALNTINTVATFLILTLLAHRSHTYLFTAHTTDDNVTDNKIEKKKNTDC